MAMYNKRRFDKRYLFILVVVAIALVLVVLAFSLQKDRDLNPIEKVAKDTITVVLKVVSAPFNFVHDTVDSIIEKNNLYEKYKELKNKEEQIDSVVSQNDNLRDEVNKLKDTLNLNTILSDKVYMNATVVTRNIGYWYDEGLGCTNLILPLVSDDLLTRMAELRVTNGAMFHSQPLPFMVIKNYMPPLSRHYRTFVTSIANILLDSQQPLVFTGETQVYKDYEFIPYKSYYDDVLH